MLERACELLFSGRTYAGHRDTRLLQVQLPSPALCVWKQAWACVQVGKLFSRVMRGWLVELARLLAKEKKGVRVEVVPSSLRALALTKTS